LKFAKYNCNLCQKSKCINLQITVLSPWLRCAGRGFYAHGVWGEE
jgi:hypothetical protein